MSSGPPNTEREQTACLKYKTTRAFLPKFSEQKNPRTTNQNGTEIVVRILKDRSSVALWAEEKLQEEREL